MAIFMSQTLFIFVSYQRIRYNIAYCFTIGITLTEAIDSQMLEAAVNLAAKRFPYFAVKLVKEGEDYFLESNDAPFIVSADGRTVTLGTAESAYHLFAFAYKDNVLYVDTSHFLTDGLGSFQFVKTILYCYLKAMHPDAEFDESTIVLPDSPILPEEAEPYPYPAELLTAEPFGSLSRPENILTLSDQPQGYENIGNWTSFRLHIKQRELLSYVSSVDGSPSSFVSSLLFRSVSDLHPDEMLPVVCGMQHQFRKALGKPFSHHCHVNIIPIVYPDSLRNSEMMKLNTISRGTLIIRVDDENDKLTINQHIANEKLMQTMSLAQKREHMQKEVLNGIGRNTYEVSYAGRVPWSGIDRYITDFSPYLDMALSGGISAEIFSIQDYFCINIMQRSPDRKYFDRMTDILRELSIPFTILEPDHFEICRFQV